MNESFKPTIVSILDKEKMEILPGASLKMSSQRCALAVILVIPVIYCLFFVAATVWGTSKDPLWKTGLLRKKTDGSNNLFIFETAMNDDGLTNDEVFMGDHSMNDGFQTNDDRLFMYDYNIGPKVAVIAYTYMGNMTKFENLIIAALETYMKEEPLYFIVMSKQWTDTYRDYCQEDSRTRRHCEKLRVLWVDCDEGWSGAVGCCKAQKGLLQMYEKYGTEFDFFVYQDDDNYLRVDMLKRFLQPLPPDEAFIVGSTEDRKIAKSIWDKYYCSDKYAFHYPWGQPMIYSRGALNVVSDGLRLNGLVSECVAYHVLHDVGFQIFNWMYSLPALLISLSDHWKGMYGKFIHSEEEVFGYHGVQNEHLTADAPPSFYTMQQAHEYYENKLGEPIEFNYQWHNATGFHLTRTYSIHHDPRTWKDAWLTIDERECKPMIDYYGEEDAWNQKKQEEKEKKEEKDRQQEEKTRKQKRIKSKEKKMDEEEESYYYS